MHSRTEEESEQFPKLSTEDVEFDDDDEDPEIMGAATMAHIDRRDTLNYQVTGELEARVPRSFQFEIHHSLTH